MRNDRIAGAISDTLVAATAKLGVLLVLGLALAACSGGDSSGSGDTNNRAADAPETVEEAPDDSGGGSGSGDSPGQDEDVSDAIDAVSGGIYTREPDYPDAVTLPMQYITTAGGKRLSVRVTLPADENGEPLQGPFPVIVTQSAYNTNLLSLMFMGMSGNLMLGAPDAFIVRRGYAQVAVDALGTGASEGAWELLGEAEQVGFADALDWAERQPWSNGRVGLAGVSYMAISSLFAAQRRPDSVDAIFASLPMGDAMRGTVGIGGMLNAVFMSEWMSITHLLATQNVQTAFLNPRHADTITRATQEHIDQLDDYHLPLINNALDGAPEYNYDGDFWRLRSPIENMHKIKAPTFFFSALHDIFQRGTPLLYEILREQEVDTRLVVYEGTHFVNFVKSHVGNDQVPPIDFLMLQWFDKYLKDMDTGTENIPQVVQHVKNYPTDSTPEEHRNDSYATATDWPHPMMQPERWYLHGDNSLSRTAPVDAEATHTMTNPPAPYGRGYGESGLLKFDLTITDGSECTRSYEQWTLGLALPQTCFWDSSDSAQQRLLFESEPMAEDYYINGPLQADIWMDSTATEAVVAVQIEEVSDAKALPVTNGQLLASGRAVDQERSRFVNNVMIQPYHYFTEATNQPLVPGEIVKLQIEIFPTSTIIRKGNRLRVSISPSNQAQAILNYPRQAMAEGGITTIHNSAEYPSSVVLPVVPVSVLD